MIKTKVQMSYRDGVIWANHPIHGAKALVEATPKEWVKKTNAVKRMAEDILSKRTGKPTTAYDFIWD